MLQIYILTMRFPEKNLRSFPNSWLVQIYDPQLGPPDLYADLTVDSETKKNLLFFFLSFYSILRNADAYSEKHKPFVFL